MSTRKIYWESECGHKGCIQTASEALAPLVRESRKDHDRRFPTCDMADINCVDDEAKYAERKRPRQRELGEGFC